MKRLVLLGEGHGEVSGLPVLARKVLRDKNGEDLFRIDYEVIRAHNADGLVRWDKQANKEDFSEWHKFVNYAARRPNLGGVLAVFDGDAKTFPTGKKDPFCAKIAAKKMALTATEIGAGATFSLAVVFACVEYETWLIAGINETTVNDGPFRGLKFPTGVPESHGKGWLERSLTSYRPTRDQKRLTDALDLQIVRAKKLRSFLRLEPAIDQLLAAAHTGNHVATPE